MPTTYCHCGDADASRVGDRIVVYARESQTSLVLNPTGSSVWGLLESPRTVDQLAHRLARDYSCGEDDQVVEDVRAYVGELVRLGVVRQI